MKIKSKKRVKSEPVQLKVVQGGPPVPQPYKWDLFEDGLTQSMIATWLKCRERFNLSVRQGMRAVASSNPIEYGNVFHEILDHVYNGIKKGQISNDTEAYRLIVQVIREIEDREAKVAKPGVKYEDLEVLYGSCEALALGYFNYHTEDYADVKWVDLEKVFDNVITIDKGSKDLKIRARGKYDGVFRDNSGKLWLLETKTKSVIEDNSIMEMLPLDLQTNFYLYNMFLTYGEEPAGVLYNVVRRPALRRSTNETVRMFAQRIASDIGTRREHYFHRYRCTVNFKRDVLPWVEATLSPVLSQMVSHYLGMPGTHYRNPTSCGFGPFSCPFMPYCSRGDATTLLVKETPFPELVTTDTDKEVS